MGYKMYFCQSVQGFWSSDHPKFCYLHRIGWSISQQCKHCHATYCEREIPKWLGKRPRARDATNSPLVTMGRPIFAPKITPSRGPIPKPNYLPYPSTNPTYHTKPHLHNEPEKKQDTRLFSATSPNANRFTKFFHCQTQPSKFAIKKLW